jgi:hypothetical protein
MTHTRIYEFNAAMAYFKVRTFPAGGTKENMEQLNMNDQRT